MRPVAPGMASGAPRRGRSWRIKFLLVVTRVRENGHLGLVGLLVQTPYPYPLDSFEAATCV